MHREQVLYFVSSLCTKVINHVRPIPQNFEKILVIKLDEIGDMIYTLHCLKALRTQHPESHITIYCRSIASQLLENQELVDHIVTDSKELSFSFDLILDMRGSWKTLWLSLLNRRAFRFDRGSIRIRNKFRGNQEHEVYTNWEIVKPVLKPSTVFQLPELAIDAAPSRQIDQLLSKIDVDQFAVMHCGARDTERRWSPDRFSEIAKHLKSRYNLSTLLVGSSDESELNDQVRNVTDGKHVYNLAGKTSLIELGELCRRATIFVGNESGPLHFATIMKTPLVALFGPGVKDVFYPLYSNQVVIHHLDEITKSNKKLNNKLMQLISISEVEKAIATIYPKPTSKTF
jgi:ADP-heptose:LPS heptosyltransferase